MKEYFSRWQGEPEEYHDLFHTGKKEWRLAFRGTAKVGQPVYPAYEDGTGVKYYMEDACKTVVRKLFLALSLSLSLSGLLITINPTSTAYFEHRVIRQKRYIQPLTYNGLLQLITRHPNLSSDYNIILSNASALCYFSTSHNAS